MRDKGGRYILSVLSARCNRSSIRAVGRAYWRDDVCNPPRARTHSPLSRQHSQSLSRARLFLIAVNSLSYMARISVSIVPNPSGGYIKIYIPLCGPRELYRRQSCAVSLMYNKIVQIYAIDHDDTPFITLRPGRTNVY